MFDVIYEVNGTMSEILVTGNHGNNQKQRELYNAKNNDQLSIVIEHCRSFAFSCITLSFVLICNESEKKKYERQHNVRNATLTRGRRGYVYVD